MTALLAIVMSLASVCVSAYTIALTRSMSLYRQGRRDWIYRKDRPT